MESTLKWSHNGSKQTEGEVLDLLYSLVRCHKPTLCIETGTFMGHGTKAIASALAENERGWLWTVENDPEVAADLRKLSLDGVSFVEEDSLAFCKEFEDPVDFAFVDCGEPPHRLEVLKALRPKTDLLCLHDTIYYPGFYAACCEAVGRASLHMRTLNGLAIWKD